MKKFSLIIILMLLFVDRVNALYFVSYNNKNTIRTKGYINTFVLNGGYVVGEPSINGYLHLPKVERKGYTFDSWEVSDDVYSVKWIPNKYLVSINPIIQNVLYNEGFDGFTFDVYLNGEIYKQGITSFSEYLEYDSLIRVVVHERTGYRIKSFIDQSWTISDDLIINPTWYDDIAPVITNFEVINYGLYNPALGDKAGWNVRIITHAYDQGTGIKTYYNWLVPYGDGSGGVRKEGNDRYMTNVLYLETPIGRTYCAAVEDYAGNVSEKCERINI